MLKGISKEKLGTLVAERIQRAESDFEKASGWKHRTLQDTLKNFSRLDRKTQLLFGGLLVTKALLPLTKPVSVKAPRAPKVAPTPTLNESAASASSGSAQNEAPSPSVEVAAANESASESVATSEGV